jgi:hypothetical protein
VVGTGRAARTKRSIDFVDGRNGVAGVGGPAFGFAPERESVPKEIARDSIVC